MHLGGEKFRRRTIVAAAATAIALKAFPQASVGQPRAFLVGNTRYRPSSQNIMTAHKNVRDLEDALTDLGYRTESVFNASKAQVLSGLDAMLASASPTEPAFVYFCGHGINSLSRGEYRNYWVAADVELSPPVTSAQDPAARRKHYEEIAQLSPSLEEDIYPRMAARANAVTFIVIDACRDAASTISDADSRVVQSRPPAGCLVGYATRPGRYAYTPRDFNQNSYFAESLIKQLRAVKDEGDMTQLLQRVRVEVRERVNGIARSEGVLQSLLGQLGLKEGFLQEPDVASNVSGRAVLRPSLRRPVESPAPVPAPVPPLPSASSVPSPKPPAAISLPQVKPPVAATPLVDGQDQTVWAQIETLTDIVEAEKAVNDFLQRFPESLLKPNATIRLEDIRRVRDAARRSRVLRTALNLPEGSSLRNDYRVALQGDKFAAQRLAEAISKTPSLGDAAAAQRWLQFSAELGNGIAAYEVSRVFNGQNLIQEASYYLALAETNGYRAPRDFDTRK
ncbi:MAG: caspase family protein [Polaromonas sp.]|nr:caspase family protein [Polaromonas sp.]